MAKKTIKNDLAHSLADYLNKELKSEESQEKRELISIYICITINFKI